MPANIATTNGRPSFMYYGEEPWHRLGQKLDAPATAADAITAAGLDYEISLTDVATVDGMMVPKTKAVVRYDNQTVLGTVSDRYCVVQNRQAFGFLDAVVADGGLRYHTAGALGQGEKIFLLAKLPGHLRVKATEDVVDKYLLLSNSHDGSSALRVLFTPVRVVCQNTLSMALRQGSDQGVSIRHNGDLTAKIRDAQRVLGLAAKLYVDAQATGALELPRAGFADASPQRISECRTTLELVAVCIGSTEEFAISRHFLNREAPPIRIGVRASHNDSPNHPLWESPMKYLHTSCLCAHGMIASTLAHDCWVVGPIETHKVIHAVAYGILGIMQGIALLVALRSGKCDEAPVE